MRLLLHICCAPCSVMCIETLRAEGIEPTGFWYNPNIHPVTEYKARKNTLTKYAADIHLRLIVKNEYGLRNFIDHVYPHYESRCGYCYLCRLEETARFAAENGYDSFSTTLLISPYQNHELIIKTAQAMAKKYHVTFLYRDFRPYFKEGQEKARAMGLYMQKYCGCVFSEEDRFLDRKKGLVTIQKYNNRKEEDAGHKTGSSGTFSFYIKKREYLFSVILRRKGHLRKMQNPDNGGEFTYNDGRQAVFQRG